MKRKTFVYRTNQEIVFLSEFGFDTYDVITPGDEVRGINLRDITSWTHEFEYDPDTVEETRTGMDLKEFAKKHAAMYKEWQAIHESPRFHNMEDRNLATKNVTDPLHDWLETQEIPKETHQQVFKEWSKGIRIAAQPKGKITFG